MTARRARVTDAIALPMKPAAISATCLALSGCAPFAFTTAPGPGPVNVSLIWTNQPTATCRARGPIGGCAELIGKTCIIRAPEPRNFEDHARLEILGHELAHCLGARHEWR